MLPNLVCRRSECRQSALGVECSQQNAEIPRCGELTLCPQCGPPCRPQRMPTLRPSRWSGPYCSQLGNDGQRNRLAEMRRRQTAVHLFHHTSSIMSDWTGAGTLHVVFRVSLVLRCAPPSALGFPLCFSAISNLAALGGTTNPLTSLCGISFWRQFHLPPIFHPCPHALT